MTSAALIIGVLARMVRDQGDHDAFVMADQHDAERTLTYAELDESSTEVALHLTGHGVGPGDVVVLAVPNQIGYFGLLFGIWKSGAAALPISPWLPENDKRALLDIVSTEIGRAVLIDSEPMNDFPTFVPETSGPLDLPTPLRAHFPAFANERTAQPNSEHPFFYVTSGGSTGLPKIVPMPLRWVASIDSPHTQPGSADDGNPAASRTRLICGDIYHTGVVTLFMHVLMTGATAISMSTFAPGVFRDLLRRHSVYYVFVTPYHMRAVLALDDIDSSVFDGISRVGHGVAPCPAWVKRGWIDLVGAERLFESYTSSELSSSSRPIRVSGEEWLRKPGTIGKGHDVKILDESGQEVAPGVIGEIFTAQRHGAANGYIGKRDLRVWQADPEYVSVADLGWVDEDGYLFIADRMSEVIVVGGTRVFPTRVEEVLGEHPLVADVAVVGVTDANGDQYVHALVEPRASAGDAFTVDVLREHWQGRLSEAEVPREVQLTLKLPRTPEGKMRRSVVRELAGH